MKLKKIRLKGFHSYKNELISKSLNEINYNYFGEATEEYHNELYGHIEYEKKIDDFVKSQGRTKEYIRIRSGNKNTPSDSREQITLLQYIRHQIHHPENKENNRFSFEELRESIEAMRKYSV